MSFSIENSLIRNSWTSFVTATKDETLTGDENFKDKQQFYAISKLAAKFSWKLSIIANFLPNGVVAVRPMTKQEKKLEMKGKQVALIELIHADLLR